MVLDAELANQLRHVWNDDDEFRSRLGIENLHNREQVLDPLFPEQQTLLDVMRRHRMTVAIKPRQVGFTTLITLFLFARTYRAEHPHQVLQTCHSPKAMKRVRRMVEVAYRSLPPQLRFGARHSADRSEFYQGAAFDRLLAGAGGQGRGATYNDVHLTEMAFYPTRTSASRQGDESSDSDILASIQSSCHDPEGRIVVESTGNGPYGEFHDLVRVCAQGDAPDVGFVFVPWSAVERYRMALPEGWERTDEEEALARQHGLDDEQLAWRRYKLRVERYTPSRFRREYPLTWQEPFLIETATWFSATSLNALSRRAPLERANDRSEYRVWEPPIVGRRYFAALDTSGGVGRDEAVLVVLRDDLVQVAQWQSKTASPIEQALMAIRVANQYDALLLVEANKYGKQVLATLEASKAVRLWRDDEGRFFSSTGAHMGDHKRELMVYARGMVDELASYESAAGPADPVICHQLGLVVEKSIGSIEARDDQHDDRAIAWCLALWCARRHYVRAQQTDTAAEAQRRIYELARDHSKFTPRSS